MVTWNCIAGSTLLVPSGSQGNHLFVVLTDPTNFDGHPPQCCISVALCTIRTTPYDATCVVQLGEHPFVTSPSYIAYRHTRIDPSSHLEEMAHKHVGFPQDTVSIELLHRVRSGIHASKQTPNFLKKLLIA